MEQPQRLRFHSVLNIPSRMQLTQQPLTSLSPVNKGSSWLRASSVIPKAVPGQPLNSFRDDLVITQAYPAAPPLISSPPLSSRPTDHLGLIVEHQAAPVTRSLYRGPPWPDIPNSPRSIQVVSAQMLNALQRSPTTPLNRTRSSGY